MAVLSASFPRPHWRLQQLVIPSLVFTVPESWGQGARFLWVNQMLKIERPLFSYKTASPSSLSAPWCAPCLPVPASTPLYHLELPTSHHNTGKVREVGLSTQAPHRLCLPSYRQEWKQERAGTCARLAVSVQLHTVWKVRERLAPRGGGMTRPPSSLLPQPSPPLFYYYYNTSINSSYHVLLLFRSVRP